MPDETIAFLPIEPTRFDELPARRHELNQFVKYVAQCALRFDVMRVIYDDTGEIALGFEAHVSRCPTARLSPGQSNRMLSVEDDVAGAVQNTLQQYVKKGSNRAEQERRIEAVSGRATVNGELGDLSPLQLQNAKRGTSSSSGSTDRAERYISQIDFAMGRVKIGKDWLSLDAQVAEEFQFELKKVTFDLYVESIDLEKTKEILFIIQKSATRALRNLDAIT